jgi:uncharacterized membrane protein
MAVDQSKRATLFYFIIALLAMVGVADSLYLTIEHLTGRSVICAFSTGCSKVLASQYAKVGPLPVAAIGVAAYFAVFSLAVLGAFGYPFARRMLVPLILIMFLMTLWLVFVQAFLLGAFCDYCMVSAGITFTLAVMVIVKAARKSQATAGG